MSNTGLALYRPAGIPNPFESLGNRLGDAAYEATPDAIIAGAMGRGRQGVESERDRQVRGAVAAAMSELQRTAPGVYRPIAAEFQRAAVATSEQVMDAALRRAAVALLQAEPYLAERIVALARQSGGAATESGLSTFAREAWPYGVLALVVAVAAYGVADGWGSKDKR